MLRHTLTLILFYAALVTSQDKPCIDDPDVDCASFKDDCTNPKLLPLLTQSCPVTCNLCPSTVSPTTLAPCFDDKSVNCNVFKKNCNDPDYIPMLKKFCPETCNMCPGATTPTPDSNSVLVGPRGASAPTAAIHAKTERGTVQKRVDSARPELARNAIVSRNF
nr:hypothetical protein Y39G8B.g - Caenorhabditis elegans [Caenorhabditis elegans]